MGSSQQTTTQRNDPYAPAQPLINQGLSDAQAMYNNGGFNITPYQGDLVADADAFTNQAYDMAPGVVGASLGGAAAAQGGIMRALNPEMRPEVVKSITDSIMPSINGSFAGSGMTGSTLHQQNLAKGLTEGLAGYQNQLDQRSLQAAGMMGQANQNLMAPLDYLRGLGSERQAQSQAEIQADVLQDQQAKTGELQALQDYLALSTGAGGMFGVQSATRTTSPGALGLAGFGVQAAPLLFSDRRLKTDIRRVGQTDDGVPIYTYRYNGGDTVHMGVMADELAEVKPQAVSERGGFRVVDYAGI